MLIGVNKLGTQSRVSVYIIYGNVQLVNGYLLRKVRLMEHYLALFQQ